jgi:thermitase
VENPNPRFRLSTSLSGRLPRWLLGATVLVVVLGTALLLGPLSTATETPVAPSGGMQPPAEAVDDPPSGADPPDGADSGPSLDASAAVPGELLVRFREDARATDRSAARESVEATLEEVLPVPGLQLVSVESGSVDEEAAELEANPEVLYAEPNYRRELLRTPDDGFFRFQWSLANDGQEFRAGSSGQPGRRGTADADIDAPEAWERTTGDASVKVAVIDSGVAEHPDLRANVWSNPDETENGADDDGNGYVDDVRGWDFTGPRGSEDGRTDDDAGGHGTHVSGTVGAEGGNGQGVAGVNWDVSLMPLQAFDGAGASVTDVIEAYDYARREGADVVNASFGAPGGSAAERDAMRRAPDVLFVAAAGNGGEDGKGDDNDGGASAQYPCSYDLENILCVAASDENDLLASFSNYGRTSVDLAAPGVAVASTFEDVADPGFDDSFIYQSGTSMATPHVAGAAALVLAAEPGLSVGDLRRRILDAVDPRSGLAATATGGRLNLDRAVRGVAGPSEPPASTGPAPSAAPSPAPSPQPSPGAPESGPGGSSDGEGDGGSSGDDSSDAGAGPVAPPPPAAIPPRAPAAPARRSSCSKLRGRRRTVCFKRSRALARCGKLSGARRTRCVGAARRIRR